MAVELYRVHLKNELFVFVTANTPARVDQISDVLAQAGGRFIAAGALSFETKTMPTASAVRDLFASLNEGECIYVVGPDGEGFSYNMIVEAKTTGGITVGS